MTHLNAEQFEDALAGSTVHADHLAGCDECRRRLEASRAVRGRLQRAFAPIKADASLAQRISAAIPEAPAPARDRRILRLRHLVPLAAAACVVLAVGVFMYPGGQAQGAQPELAAIHMAHLAGTSHDGSQMYQAESPEQLAAFLRGKLGAAPTLPKMGKEVKPTCCCLDTFRGRTVGSYVLQTPKGIVTVVVLPDSVESLKLKHEMTLNGRKYAACRSQNCNIVAARCGQFTYCVVGELKHDLLLKILERIVCGDLPDGQPGPCLCGQCP